MSEELDKLYPQTALRNARIETSGEVPPNLASVRQALMDSNKEEWSPSQVELTRITRSLATYLDFYNEWDQAETSKRGGIQVFGKRIPNAAARGLQKKACAVIAESFSVFEMARLLQSGHYTLEAYMETLREIRDDKGVAAKDRMLAADKIQQTALGLLRAHTETNLPSTLSSGQLEEGATKNMMAVLVNINQDDLGPNEPPKGVEETDGKDRTKTRTISLPLGDNDHPPDGPEGGDK